MQSTIELFHHLANSLPPVVPSRVARHLAQAIKRAESDPSLTVEHVEDMMIAVGYEVWPYARSYQDFLNLYEAKLGEHFFLPKLSPAVLSRYQEFKLYGGTLRDLHSGRPADFFSSEERGELCAALVDLQQDLRQYVDHQIITTERKIFMTRVQEFSVLLKDIKVRLIELKALAEIEQSHPALADQIRGQVRAFEFGLCNLGPELDYAAVCSAPEYFHGRGRELQRLRGIHLPLEIDFYAAPI